MNDGGERAPRAGRTHRRWRRIFCAAVWVLGAAVGASGADRVSTFRNGTANWNNPGAWNPTGVPNDGALTYDAVFNGSYYGATGDTLGLNIDVTIQKFTMTGGYVVGPSGTGPFTLTLQDAFTWSRGVFTKDNIVATAGGSIAATATCILGTTTLENDGVLRYTASFNSTPDGQLPLRLDSGGVIVNRAGATFDIAGDGGISVTGGNTRVDNSGLWVKSAGTGVSVIRVGFNDTGTMRAQSGTLELVGGLSQHSGTVEASAGATFFFLNGAQTFTPTARLGGEGTLQIACDDFEFNGVLSGGAGAVQVLEGQAHFNSGADVRSLGVAVKDGGRALRLIRQGTTNFDTGRTVELADLATDTSASPYNTAITLTGGDDLSITGPANWTGGTVGGPLAVPVNTLTVNADLTISGAGMAVDHRRIRNRSTIHWTGGYLQAKRGAVFENTVDGTFDIGTDTRLEWGPTQVDTPLPVFENAGLLVKSAGSGETLINDVRLTNTGTLRVASGKLTLLHTGGSGAGRGFADTGVNSGVYEVLAGATLDVSDHTMDASSTVRGAGTMQFRSNTNVVAGTYAVSGRTNAYGGLVFRPGANVTDVGQTLDIEGDATFDTGRPVTLRDVILNGTLAGSDPIEITGTVSGNGTLTANDVIASGQVAPGNSPGTLNASGKLTFKPSTQLQIELALSDHDMVVASGPLTLDGILALHLIDGYVPSASDRLTILSTAGGLSGTFDDVLPGGRLNTVDGKGSFVVSYGVTSPFGKNNVVLSNFKVAPAPEPAALVLAPIATVLFLRGRRR